MAVATTSTPGANPTGHEYVDGLIWGSSWDTSIGGSPGTISYSFDNGSLGERRFTTYMKVAIREAFDVIEDFIPIKFNERSFLTSAGEIRDVDLSYALVTQDTLGGSGAVGFHQVPGDTPLLSDALGIDALFGLFAYDTVTWSKDALEKGGIGFATILHEIMHGLGLAHPHDSGGDSSIFPGVSSAGDYGTDDQNQGVFTVMSYNSGYPEVIRLKYYDIGSPSTPMALDIAALQAIYGTRNKSGSDNVYRLKGKDADGASWKSIWDTGGKDTISAEGVKRSVKINLNAADLEGHDAGGSPSYTKGVQGGYTIANSVVIENAIGGDGKDVIIGNEVANNLKGERGNDKIYGGAGRDYIKGGRGNDKLSGDSGSDKVYGYIGRDKFLARDGDGDDYYNGGKGEDWILFKGSEAATVDLQQTTAQDTGYGKDRIARIEHVDGSAQSDEIKGSSAENTLLGKSGNDTINGRRGKDKLDGGHGDDTLLGGSGSDKIKGGSGNDILNGGRGGDVLRGGSGEDHFVFYSVHDSKNPLDKKADVIRDFKGGEDKIDLSAIDANSDTGEDDVFVFNGKKRISSSDEGEIYYKRVNKPGSSNDETIIYVDTDGDRDAEMVIRLSGLHNLTEDDFIL